MERLHLGPGAQYSALEAAIHIARYALAKSVCAHKTVLDVACGEGYGSWLLASWGAGSVTGIDVSPEAIAFAQQRFGGGNIEFRVADATRLRKQLGGKRFDLIVSIETIEHVNSPEKYLREIKAAAAPGATIIITCPNDHWYYKESEGNPFHTKKYRLEEFQILTQSVLGPATSFRIGSLTAGFGSIPATSQTVVSAEEDQSAMVRVRPISTGLMVPNADGLHPTPEDCSFFVGIWGEEIDEISAVTYPLSMNASDQPLFGGPHLSDLNEYVRKLEARRDELEAEFARAETMLANARSERESLRSELVDLRSNREARGLLASLVDTLERELAGLAAELRTTRESWNIFRVELAERDGLAEQLRSQLQEYEGRIKNLEAAKGQADELSRKLTADLASRSEDSAVLEGKLHRRDDEVLELQRALRGASLRLRGVAAENQVLRERTSQLLQDAAALKALEQRIAEQQQTMDDIDRARSACHARLGAAEVALREAGTRLQEVNAENSALHEKTRELAGQLENVPWRVVGVYRKFRPLFPGRLLKLGASMIDSRGRRP